MSNVNGDDLPVSRSELRAFAESKQETLTNNPQLNEEETKTAVINDFVELLGWQIPRDGRMEYQFGGHNTNVADYAFFHNGTSKLFIEAKAPSAGLTDGHRDQIREYLVLDNADLGVLTNGEVYELYRRHITDDGEVRRQRVDAITLEEFPDKAVLLNTLTKTQVTSGTYAERLERYFELQEAQQRLNNNQENIAGDIVETVTAAVGSIAEQPARTRVIEYLNAVQGELAEMSPGEPQKRTPRELLATETPIVFENGETVFAGEASARDHFRAAVQTLFRYGHLTTEDVPITAGSKRYILNTEPVDRDGEQMADGEEVVEGVFAELNAGTAQLERFVTALLQTTGTPPVETSDQTDGDSATDSTGETTETATETTDLEIAMPDNEVLVNTETEEPLFPLITRETLSGEPSAKIGIYASDFDRGLPFIAQHESWGFINIASEPEYFCIYLNRPYQQVQLIGKVSDIVSKERFFSEHEVNRDPADIDDSKMVVKFETVYQFENPIAVGETSSRMQGLLYTTLEKLKTAETTEQL
jgi:predicted type IV restriction endonuclease